MVDDKCQIFDLPGIAGGMKSWQRVSQRRMRMKRIIKRRLRYVRHLLAKMKQRNEKGVEPSIEERTEFLNLLPGDMVRIKSEYQIKATLDGWNSLKGCVFMEEMWPYCGSVHRVFKRVNQFLDERTYLVRKCRGIVLLENLICTGTKDFGPCDRSCYLFWREEWLEKIDAGNKADSQ